MNDQPTAWPYLSLRLDTLWLPPAAAAAVVFVGDRPFYRATAAVVGALARAVESLWERSRREQDSAKQAEASRGAAILVELVDWLHACGGCPVGAVAAAAAAGGPRGLLKSLEAEQLRELARVGSADGAEAESARAYAVYCERMAVPGRSRRQHAAASLGGFTEEEAA